MDSLPIGLSLRYLSSEHQDRACIDLWDYEENRHYDVFSVAGQSLRVEALRK